jgi:hypothetical protein
MKITTNTKWNFRNCFELSHLMSVAKNEDGKRSAIGKRADELLILMFSREVKAGCGGKFR